MERPVVFSTGVENQGNGDTSSPEPTAGTIRLGPIDLEALRGLAALESDLASRKRRVFEALIEDYVDGPAQITGIDLAQGVAHWRAT